MNLTTHQKQYLKGLAHHLKPVVLMGSNGLSDAFLAETQGALAHHELIKVKITASDRHDKRRTIDAICAETRAAEVQAIGHIVVLYLPSEAQKITLPRAAKSKKR